MALVVLRVLNLYLDQLAEMLWVSINPPKHKDAKIFENHLNPYNVGIHLIAPAEYSQINTHVLGFQSFFRFSAPFCNGQISHQQHKG